MMPERVPNCHTRRGEAEDSVKEFPKDSEDRSALPFDFNQGTGMDQWLAISKRGVRIGESNGGPSMHRYGL